MKKYISSVREIFFFSFLEKFKKFFVKFQALFLKLIL